MRKSRIAILALAPALLCSCATKCSFADFQSKVAEIQTDYTNYKMVVKGSLKVDDTEYTIDSENTSLNYVVGNKLAEAALVLNKVFAYSAVEDTNATYYAGSSFKYKADGLTIAWDKYGNCTKVDGVMKSDSGSVSAHLSASYKYEK